MAIVQELFFKITIAHRIDLPLSLTELRAHPTHKMYLAEYEEKIFNVMYMPANGFNKESFIELMKKKLKKQYNTAMVEHLEKLNLIENER